MTRICKSKIEQLLELMAAHSRGRIEFREWLRRFTAEHSSQRFGEPHDTVTLLIEGALTAPISGYECGQRLWLICATAEAMFGGPPEERKFAKVTKEDAGRKARGMASDSIDRRPL